MATGPPGPSCQIGTGTRHVIRDSLSQVRRFFAGPTVTLAKMPGQNYPVRKGGSGPGSAGLPVRQGLDIIPRKALYCKRLKHYPRPRCERARGCDSEIGTCPNLPSPSGVCLKRAYSARTNVWLGPKFPIGVGVDMGNVLCGMKRNCIFVGQMVACPLPS